MHIIQTTVFARPLFITYSCFNPYMYIKTRTKTSIRYAKENDKEKRERSENNVVLLSWNLKVSSKSLGILKKYNKCILISSSVFDNKKRRYNNKINIFNPLRQVHYQKKELSKNYLPEWNLFVVTSSSANKA